MTNNIFRILLNKKKLLQLKLTVTIFKPHSINIQMMKRIILFKDYSIS